MTKVRFFFCFSNNKKAQILKPKILKNINNQILKKANFIIVCGVMVYACDDKEILFL